MSGMFILTSNIYLCFMGVSNFPYWLLWFLTHQLMPFGYFVPVKQIYFASDGVKMCSIENSGKGRRYHCLAVKHFYGGPYVLCLYGYWVSFWVLQLIYKPLFVWVLQPEKPLWHSSLEIIAKQSLLVWSVYLLMSERISPLVLTGRF